MKISYYLNQDRKKNLYCRISDGTERVSFSLGYSIPSENWNSKAEEGSHEDPYFYTLSDFRKYLSNRYHELKSEATENVLAMLKLEAERFIDGSGIKGIARKMFDTKNSQDSIPSFDQFTQAFEKHSQLTANQYEVRTLDNTIEFITGDGEAFIIDTYEGLRATLNSYIERRSYDEIFTMTDQNIWREIYVDGGIEKSVFLPRMLSEWELFWDDKYSEIRKSVGKTDHLDQQKSRSWRQMIVFMECYEDAGDIIHLALELDECDLYPIAVITMLKIFDPSCCYDEYCESEFSGEDWASIDLNQADIDDEDYESDSPIFYIKRSDY